MTGSSGARLERLPGPARAALAALVVVVALVAGSRLLDRAVGGGDPSGPPSSSYSTTSTGLDGYARLLGRFGHPVTRARGALADASLDPAVTLLVVDPGAVTRADAEAMRTFVRGGGRLVLAGQIESPFEPDAGPGVSEIGAPGIFTSATGEYSELSRVVTAGRAAFRFDAAGARVWEGDRVLLAQTAVGSGEVLFLADSSAIDNGHLGEADNAAFALLLAGDAGREVVFAEGPHGYGEARGLRAVPSRWKAVLLVLGLAALALMWARGRRFGPSEQRSRPLPPPRAEYVFALGRTLERTRDRRSSLASLQHAARLDIARRAGLPAGAGIDAVRAAATGMGLTADEQAALWTPIENDQQVLALGRALARVRQIERTNR